MAIEIVVSDTVRFKVEGVINDANGTAKPFSFWLQAERLADNDAVNAYLQEMQACESKSPITDTMLPRMRGWSDVKDKGGAPLEWSEAAFRQLMARPGVAYLAHQAFLRDSGAKEKN